MAATPTPLRLAMAERGFNASSLARALGCHRTHLTHVLAGRRTLLDPYRAKAVALGFTEAELSTEPIDLVDRLRVAEVTREAVAASREAQGLSATVTDDEVLDAVARILARALLGMAPAKAEAVG